jgi:hypothetical protein
VESLSVFDRALAPDEDEFGKAEYVEANYMQVENWDRSHRMCGQSMYISCSEVSPRRI